MYHKWRKNQILIEGLFVEMSFITFNIGNNFCIFETKKEIIINN